MLMSTAEEKKYHRPVEKDGEHDDDSSVRPKEASRFRSIRKLELKNTLGEWMETESFPEKRLGVVRMLRYFHLPLAIGRFLLVIIDMTNRDSRLRA